MALVTRTSGKSVKPLTGAAAAAADTNDHILLAATTGKQTIIDKYTVTNTSATDAFITWKSNGVVIWYTPAPKAGGCDGVFPTGLPSAQSGDISYALSGNISGIYVCAAGYQQENS